MCSRFSPTIGTTNLPTVVVSVKVQTNIYFDLIDNRMGSIITTNK